MYTLQDTAKILINVYLPCGKMSDEVVGHCRRLASERMSMIRVANSLGLKRASFWRPWFRVDEKSGLTGKKGTGHRSTHRAVAGCIDCQTAKKGSITTKSKPSFKIIIYYCNTHCTSGLT